VKTASKQTEQQELRLLKEITAFGEELLEARARVRRQPASDRRGVSTAPAKDLLAASLERIKEFLLHKSQSQPLSPEQIGEEAYALWLFASYLAAHQGMTLLETDFDALYEFFFWWYPRQCDNASGALTGRLFASLAELFAYLTEDGALPDDRAVRDFWPFSERAAQLLALYERLDPESPFFEEQFEALFGLEPPEG